MTSLVSTQRQSGILRYSLSRSVFAALALCTLPAATGAGPAVQRVKGYFCNAKSDQVAYLTLRARGESEEMAANARNKEIARFSCAYYIPADAIQTGNHTVIDGGLVYRLQSYLFLPEKVERWSGSVLGAMPQQPRVSELDL